MAVVIDEIGISIDMIGNAIGKIDGIISKISNTIGKIDGTISKISNTIGKIDGTISKIDNTIDKISNSINKISNSRMLWSIFDYIKCNLVANQKSLPRSRRLCGAGYFIYRYVF